MPCMTIYLGERGLFDVCLDLEAVSNIRVMSASVDGNGFADVYYIEDEYPPTVGHDAEGEFKYSCIHAAYEFE